VDQPEGVARTRFADADNGWAFGSAMWTTHDAGAHWSRSTLPGAVAEVCFRMTVGQRQCANETVRVTTAQVVHHRE
jgi:photosystem II stability/assembly factor-like uncharacterized protein